MSTDDEELLYVIVQIHMEIWHAVPKYSLFITGGGSI